MRIVKRRTLLAAITASVLVLAGAPGSASAALQISAPSLVPTMTQSGYVSYEVYATATGQYEHPQRCRRRPPRSSRATPR